MIAPLGEEKYHLPYQMIALLRRVFIWGTVTLEGKKRPGLTPIIPRPSQKKSMETVTATTKKINTPAGGSGPLLNLFQESLPVRPYCTDELGILFIRPLAQAIKRRYIQQNSPWDLKWLVYDVDRETAHFDWYDMGAPPPNMTAMNRANGHAHLFYGLETAVFKQPEARAAPLRYAASVDVALTLKLEADPGYSGLICKNPLNDYWDVQTWEPYPYDLTWMSDYLDLSPYADKRRHLPGIGLGRNCTLFDVTRHWAYRQIRKGGFFNEDFFVYECTQYAGERNGEFQSPLPWSEVKATGKSVGKWTYRNFSPEGFRAYQRRANKKSQTVRKARSADRADEIRAYKADHPEAKVKNIAEKFGVSEITVKRLKLKRGQ